MAAKQGFTAHISQASDDAKRAVLSRAPAGIKSHSWLSNLNTTCTIKSAPPRTPEVMTLLSVKSGWLVKRNEQHVWQRRWCCVVPHMMLYYFEAEPESNGDDSENQYITREGFSGGGIYRSDATIVENQEILNDAVRDGYHDAQIHSTPLKGRDCDFSHSPNSAEKKMLAAPVRGPTTSSGNLSPSGIIDLECYSTVNRSSVHDCVFEVSGDSVINPDLRSFYFQAGNVEDCETWTNALLSDRHSALKDEREAYRQVCDSFQLQLQNMSNMIDTAEGRTADADRQLYNVRSKAQKYRSQIASVVREALEQKPWNSSCENDKVLEMSRLNHLDQFDEILACEDSLRSSKKSDIIPVQVLADYIATVIGSHTELAVQLTSTKQKLHQSTDVDNATVSDLKLQIERLEAEREEDKARYEGKFAGMEAQLYESQRAFEELENQLQTQRMEFTMFQNQAKSKLQELSAHKKVLKKEVIKLRNKKEDVESERDAAFHVTDSHKMQVENAKEKNQVLEKYIEKIETQVRVQHNMMEMISVSGMSHSGMSQGGDSHFNGGSVVGRIIGAPDDNSFSSFGNMMTQRLRDASPHRLPPTRRPLLPPGPPVASISKKEMQRATSPLSPHSPKKESRKFGAEEMQRATSPLSPPPTGKISRGVLDQEFSNAHSTNVIAHTPPVSSRQIDNEDNGKSLLTHEKRIAKYKKALNDKKYALTQKRDKDDTPKTNNHATGDDSDSVDGEDDKTNVSELTEDRTQRHIDGSTPRAPIHYTTSDTTGENIIADGRTLTYDKRSGGKPSEVRYEKAPPQEKEDFPPRYIMGASEESSRNGEDVHNSKQEDMQSIAKSVITDHSGGRGTKLSIAQRARIAAEKESNSVNYSIASEPVKLSEGTPERGRLTTRSQSPGARAFSNLSKKFISAVDNSFIGIKDTQANEANLSTDTDEPKLTLAQRQKIQRQRQLLVLREEGLIKNQNVESPRRGSVVSRNSGKS